uniref:NAD(P)-dependent oxidoreductase n=1 Tax=Acinetobacter pittii TaxID=48296 RepID=UPI001BDBA7E5|nr:NAD(P)-dependent oxidoreductase [Acinetobacter pittii]
MKVGMLGLGNMGAGMATTLASKDFEVYGFDLSPEAMARVLEKGVKPVESLKELLDSINILIISLPKAEHVEAAILGENGVLTHGHAGLIVIDTTTSTPETSRKVAAELVKKDMSFADAPVSGGPKGAASGTMTMVIGAEDDVVEKIRPVLSAMSTTQVHIGGIGAGNVAKIANNLLSAAHLITTAEAISLAVNAGVDANKVLEGINAGSGRSAVSQVMFPQWVLSKAYDSGFSMGLMRKDVGLAADMADALDLDLPLSRKIIDLWRQSSKQQLLDTDDFTAIVKYTDQEFFG